MLGTSGGAVLAWVMLTGSGTAARATRLTLLAATAPGGLWPTIVLAVALLLATIVVIRTLIRRPAEQSLATIPISPAEVALTLILLGLAVMGGLLPNLLPAVVARMLGVS